MCFGGWLLIYTRASVFLCILFWVGWCPSVLHPDGRNLNCRHSLKALPLKLQIITWHSWAGVFIALPGSICNLNVWGKECLELCLLLPSSPGPGTILGLTEISFPMPIWLRLGFMPVPICQIIASAGWVLKGHSLAWSSYQIVLWADIVKGMLGWYVTCNSVSPH